MVDLLRTKLFTPHPRENQVTRSRLVDRLNAGLDKKLTLIAAPAGFGKTTLLSEWVPSSPRPVTWLSLDEEDNDPPRFWAHFIASLQGLHVDLGASALALVQSPQPPPMGAILTELINDLLDFSTPFASVLDDYHFIDSQPIHEALCFLLDHLPSHVNLVIATREDPPLPLARLRARDQLTEIRAQGLRFTQEETDAFLRGVMGLELTEQDVALLGDRTEGWAVGLQLAGLSMQRQADRRAFIADFSGSHRHILDYLSDEVLQRQPEDVRTFLLQTAVLDRLCGPLCDALTGRTDGGRRLEQLEAANLFVIPLDEERRWYRYHHLFADLLRNQLSHSHPEWKRDLHRSASGWFEENGDIHAAIEHALQASDLPRITRLIEQHTLPRLYQGEVTKVVAWFDRLPEAVLQPAPMVCIGKAWALALLQRGARPEQVEQALHAADLALDRANADEALRARATGHAASIRAFLLRMPALRERQPERLIAVSQEALRLLPPEEKAIRATAALNMAFGFLAQADLKSAEVAFGQTLEDGLAGGNNYAAIHGPVNLIISRQLEGRLKDALQMCDVNIDRFNRTLAGQYFPPIGALFILKGSILLELDCLQEAEQYVTEGLDMVRWTGESVAPKKGYVALARLRAIQGDRPAAIEAAQSLERIWPEGALYAQALRHRLCIRHWPEDPVVRKEAHAWLAQAQFEFDQLGAIKGVDPLSTSIFECLINAAHVLAHVAKADPARFPLGSAHAGLERVSDFAASHGFVGWVVESAIARILLDLAVGNTSRALKTLQGALRQAAPTGLWRTFLDEGEPLQALLRELKPRLADETLLAYVNHLLRGTYYVPAIPATVNRTEDRLSKRELEVLLGLAEGLSYEEIGRHLFLSLSTVQFHVKNIYGKLQVNKRVQAIERARQLQMI